MKLSSIAGLLCLGALALAQNVQFDYDRTANFSAYRTYEWAEGKGPSPSQLMDQNIKRAVDMQLAAKGLQRVERNGDIQVAYQAGVNHEKQFDGWGGGPRFRGNTRVTST